MDNLSQKQLVSIKKYSGPSVLHIIDTVLNRHPLNMSAFNWVYILFALLPLMNMLVSSWLILGLHPAHERRRYKVTPSLIGWVQT